MSATDKAWKNYGNAVNEAGRIRALLAEAAKALGRARKHVSNRVAQDNNLCDCGSDKERRECSVCPKVVGDLAAITAYLKATGEMK